MTNYECLCGAQFTIDSEVSRVWEPCPDCGTSVKANLGLGIYTYCANREWVYDKRKNVPNQGWKHGKSDMAQHRDYVRMMGAAKTRMAQARRDGGKKRDDEWTHLGRMPIEMHESIVEQQGDKEFFQKAAQSGELEQILKKTDCHLGGD